MLSQIIGFFKGKYIMRIVPHSQLEKHQRHQEFSSIKIPEFLILPLLFYIRHVRPMVNTKKKNDLLVNSSNGEEITDSQWTNAIRFLFSKIHLP